jgi:CRP/FNR family transcriptional regulator
MRVSSNDSTNKITVRSNSLIGQANKLYNPDEALFDAPFSHLCCFLNIDPSGKDNLGLSYHYKIFRKDRYIYQCGETLLNLYIVAEGTAKVMFMRETHYVISGLYVPGNILGLDGVDSFSHKNTAIALSDLLALRIPYKTLLNYCHVYPEFHAAVTRVFSDEIRQRALFMDVLARSTVQTKVAFFIVNMAVRMGTETEPLRELIISPPRREIASYLGMAYETLSRSFGDLCESGVIECERNVIIIKDFQELVRRCSPYYHELIRHQEL